VTAAQALQGIYWEGVILIFLAAAWIAAWFTRGR
jgi:hypothetical protein